VIRAYSLFELMVVLTVSLFLMSVTCPLFSRQLEESRFRAFCAELSGHLTLARHVAQVTETPVRMALSPDRETRYRCLQDTNGKTRTLSVSSWQAGYNRKIGNHLPASPLPHPTGSGKLVRALSSTHAPDLVFGGRGASSATVVFSDGDERTVCVVVSGQTGRFRIFRWQPDTAMWKALY